MAVSPTNVMNIWDILVLRVHRKIKRKGRCWTAGQNIKVLKGACSGCHRTNVYATLEYIIFEGLEGESSGKYILYFGRTSFG